MKKQRPNGRRRYNALKHGAFATELLILNEEQSEFDDLHNGFIEELKPFGRMEYEIVFEIAKLHWRKRRIERFFVNEADWILADAAGDEDLECVVLVNRTIVKGLPCRKVWEGLIPFLPEVFRDEVKQYFHCPSEEYDDAWIERLKQFIANRSLTMVSAFQDRRNSARIKGETTSKLSEISAKRMALEERLDAAIDKALKRYAQLKTFKEVMAVKEREAPRKLSAG